VGPVPRIRVGGHDVSAVDRVRSTPNAAELREHGHHWSTPTWRSGTDLQSGLEPNFVTSARQGRG
jgi:hypothetical protein